ncbi:MAG: PQQ-binding-like beta-propeller repeat protein [Sandaracinaceae bacterium]|nr:PQQ-binding-like beta-propeller repeat protein [Sandaracinaceae bacterium]
MTYREEATPGPVVVTGYLDVYAFDRATGAMLWQQKTPSSVRRFIVTDDRVFVLLGDATMMCFDAMSGTLLGSVPTPLSGGEALLYDRGTLFAVGSKGVVALDRSGQVLWTQPLPTNFDTTLRGVGVAGQVCQPDYDTR